MEPVVFNSSDFKPKWARTYMWILALSIIIGGGYFVYSNQLGLIDDILSSIGIFWLPILAAPFVYKFYFYKKPWKVFVIDGEGLRVGSTVYPWHTIYDYHMLGESQHERLGIINYPFGFHFLGDPINPYIKEGIYVIRLRSPKIPWWQSVRVQMSLDKVPLFEQLMSEHNIKRQTKKNLFIHG